MLGPITLLTTLRVKTQTPISIENTGEDADATRAFGANPRFKSVEGPGVTVGPLSLDEALGSQGFSYQL